MYHGFINNKRLLIMTFALLLLVRIAQSWGEPRADVLVTQGSCLSGGPPAKSCAVTTSPTHLPQDLELELTLANHAAGSKYLARPWWSSSVT